MTQALLVADDVALELRHRPVAGLRSAVDMVNKSLKSQRLARFECAGQRGELRLFRVPFAATIAIAGATSTMAEIPAPTLFGVERVVIACDADSSLTDFETREICAQLVKKAQAATSLPVIRATAADLHPSDVKQGEQLVLHLALSADKLKDDRGTLRVTVTPSRNYLKFNEGAPMRSEAQLARLQNKWVVQGPVDAFGKILGSAPPKLRRPIKSD
jgi:hypothetical protein